MLHSLNLGSGLAVYYLGYHPDRSKVSKPPTSSFTSEMEELNSTASHSTRLPVELHRNIIQFIPAGNDLTNLCKVSRLFKNEAQPILYGSSELLHYDYDRIMAWSRTIDSHPHLAHMVHFLTIPYELPLSSGLWARGKFHTSLAGALKRTINLKGIFIIESPETSVRTSGRMFTLLPKMLMGCGFRLRSFCGRLSSDAFLVDWWKFFREQKEIRYWEPVPRIPGHGMIIPRDIFPELAAIVLRQTESMSNTNLLLHLGPRPIHCLSLEWEMSMGNPLYIIKWFVDTITHFNWEAVGSTYRTPTALDIILAIIVQLPGLKFFRFASEQADSVCLNCLFNENR